MKVNQVGTNQSFGCIIIKGSSAKRAFIEKNIVPKIINNPVIEQLDKMGLDVRFREGFGLPNNIKSPNIYDTVVELLPQASERHSKWVADLPDSNKAGVLTKKVKLLPQQLKVAAIRMLGGAKDYWDAVLSHSFNLH